MPKILLVDDAPDILEVLSILLKLHKHETFTASSKNEFLSALKKREEELKLPENEVKAEEAKVDIEIKASNEQVDKIAKAKEEELMSI